METHIEIILAYLLAFLVCLVLTPVLIQYSRKKDLVDVPNHRASHSKPTPTLGGIPIFAGLLSVLIFCLGVRGCVPIFYLIISMLILITMGVFDDIFELRASFRMAVQFALAIWIASMGVRFTSLHGILGIYDLPIVVQYLLTVIFIVGITNAFNLIDGIDGLAGGLGLINMLVLGVLFVLQGKKVEYVMSFAMAGSLLAFLLFNFNQARIFMGDTGSLILGFLTSYLCIRFTGGKGAEGLFLSGAQTLSIVLAIVIVPAYDMLRVAIKRVARGNSPFSADKTHIHHLLTKTGMNHMRAATILYFVQSLILFFTFWLGPINYWEGIFLAITIAVLIVEYPTLIYLKTAVGNLLIANRKRRDLISKNRFL